MKLKNVSGVPLCFDGVDGTVRFNVGQTVTIEDKYITQSLQDGIDSKILAVLPEVKHPKVDTAKETRKSTKVKEVNK